RKADEAEAKRIADESAAAQSTMLAAVKKLVGSNVSVHLKISSGYGDFLFGLLRGVNEEAGIATLTHATLQRELSFKISNIARISKD
ncbi:hypothetical protein P5705_18225, partial [Pseudomonas entomophila]|uniref:hypothetical protein n=1 Tax=Pseudomonas entomophila TaxID=312306 RepID=UPI00240739CA